LFLIGSIFTQRRSLQPKLSEPKDLSQWTIDGSGEWKVENNKLIITKAGITAGPIRRPAALAILKSDDFQRVTLEVQVKSNAPLETERRDIDLVFGYRSAAQFYYVHLSGVADDVHNGIFVVANADRRRIDTGKGLPQLRDQDWHHVRLVRDGVSGQIDVYVDNSSAPVLSAVDKTFPTGRIGFGSFDDTGEFKSIWIHGD
jgi:hypothetical protein